MAWKFWSSSSVAKGSFNRRNRRRQTLACTMEFLERRRTLSASWTPLTNAAPSGIHTMLLLPNGSVLSQLGGGTGWALLTPSSTGSYINGTWTTLASMNDTRQYYSSQVLQNGSVFIAGGEYGTGDDTAEVYNPVTNTWTLTPQPTFGAFEDSISEILPNGNVMVAPVYATPSGTTAIYNPTTNTWSQGPLLYRGSDADEQSWVKLADGSILTVDGSSTSERYIPSLNQWVNDGTVPVDLWDGEGEIGAGALMANGKVFFLGASGNTAIYTPSGTSSPGTWVAGPVIPDGLGTDDAPAAVLPDGTVLCATGPSDTYNGPVTFFIYNPTTNAFSTVAGAPTSGVPYGDRMLDLPDGTVLFNNGGATLYDYNPAVTSAAGVQPTINSIVKNSDGSYLLTGTQLNGFTEGAYYGDDAQMNSNYPIVRLTSSSGTVYDARTYNWSSTGVATGTTPETTDFRLPLGLPAGTYSLIVDGNGIASSVYSFTTAAVNDAAPTIATPAAASQNPVVTTSVNLSVLGASTTGESNMFYSWAATTVPSGVTAPTFSANGTYAAKNTTATFSGPGNYVFTATVYDTYGRTVTSSVSVTVTQNATITILPNAYTLMPNESAQFSASAVDQFGVAMPLTYTWSTTNGNITQAGLYTAPNGNGSGTITAKSGAFSSTITVNVHPALTWTGAGTNNNWSNPANWAGGIAPVAGDQLIFAGTTQTATNNDYAAGTTFRSITFQSSNFTLSGNSVTLDNLSGPIITNTGTNTINLAVAFPLASTIAVTSGTLNMGGGLTSSAALTLTGAGTFSLTQSGWLNSAVILSGPSLVLGTNGAWGGLSQAITQTQASSVTIAGNNTFYLEGNNTYTGGTTINSGATLSLGDNTAAGSVLGAITDNGTLAIYQSGSVTFTNNVTGTGNLHISSNVTDSSNTINIGGNLNVDANMTLTIQAGDAVTIGGHAWIAQLNYDERSYVTITGGTFTVVGALSDDRDSWFGITQSGGVVTLGSMLANQTSSGNSGGTVTNSIYTLTGGQLIVGNISGGTGSGSWNRGIDLELGGGTLTDSASFTMSADTVNLTGTNGNVTMDTGSYAVSSAYAFTGTGGLTKIGAGTLNLLAGYTGSTTVNNGTLNINSATTTSAVTVTSGTLNLNGLTTTGAVGVSGGTLNINGATTSGAVTVNGGIMNLNRALTTSAATTVSSGTLNVNSALTTPTLNIGAGTVHFANSGAASFNPNSISGLQVQLDASTLAAGAITTWNNAYAAGSFTGGGTVQSGGALFDNKDVVHFNGSQTLINATNFSTGAVTVMYVGALDGTQNARLVSAVSNNWLLGYWSGDQNEAYFNGWVSNPGTTATTAAMLYEGTIDASGNAVAYNNGTALASGTGKQGPNGLSLGGNNGGGNNNAEDSQGSIGELLVYNTVLTAAQRASVEAYLNYKWFGEGIGSLSTNTAVNITGGGTLDLNGVNQTIASLNGTGGAVTLGVTNGIGGILTTGGDNSNAAFAGVISGDGGLTKQGTGAFTLSGANTYGLPTTINGGTLILNASMPYNSTKVNSGGTLAGNGTTGLISVLSGGTLAPGNGGIGTLTGSQVFLSGTTTMEINKATGMSDELVSVGSSTAPPNITYGGTLNVTNLAGTLAAGDTFTLFSASNVYSTSYYGGSFSTLNLPTLPSNLSWNTSNLTTNGSISVVANAPTVATAAAANPNPLTGTTTNLSVLGASGAGESTLSYTWAATSIPNGATAPTFSINGNNTAKNTLATFTKAGAYTFVATITDGSGNTVTSSVNVTVNQTLTSIIVTPGTIALASHGTQQFAAIGYDQFGQAITSPPAFTWSSTGVGSVNTTGLYTGSYASGSATVTATSGTVINSASVTVTNAAPTVATVAYASANPVTGTTTTLSVLGADDAGESNLTYSWAATTLPAGATAPTFTSNGSNASKTTIATFTKAGAYTFTATITDAGGLSTTSSVNVTVNQTLTSIIVTPGTASISSHATQQFAATVYDQFGQAITSPPAFTWSSTGVGSVNTTGLYTGSYASGSATVTATSGTVSNSASVTVTNAAPTVTTAANASANPVTGTTTMLSVLGADDAGESNLTYSWAATTLPAGATAPTFSINGSNAAKTTLATFTKAGAYTLTATITDAGGLSTTSSVNVTVNQTLTSIIVTPGTIALASHGTQQFAAIGYDQFGQAITSPPAFTWSSTGVGSVNTTGLYTGSYASGSATVTATSGTVINSASVTVTNAAPTVATAANASANPVTGTTTMLSVLGADDAGESNLTYSWAATTLPAGATAPIFTSNGSNASKTTIATFTKAGAYTFTATITDAGGLSTTSSVNVTVNQTLTSIIVTPGTASISSHATQQFAATGYDQFGQAITSPPAFTWSSTGAGSVNSTGLYTGSYASGSATVTATSGTVSNSASVTVTNAAPTVATAAKATSNPVTGKTTVLSVLGADDAGESNLTYTWSATSLPAGAIAPTYSANATNAAKSSTATFSKAGAYTFTATILDAGGLSTTSSVNVTVNQTLTSIAITPSTTTVSTKSTRQFTATANDQFGNAMTTQPTITWTVSSGSGTINTSGLYTAPANAGSAKVKAASGTLSSTAAVTIAAPFQVSLASYFNRIGIYANKKTFSATGGLDGNGYAMSSALLGSSVSWSNATFAIGSAGANDVVNATGQTITMTQGNYTSLKFLAASVNGSQAGQTFTVHYTDGTSTTYTQGISDWTATTTYAGESVALSMTYRNRYNGTKVTGSYKLYGYTLALDPTKTLASITLPNNSNVNLFAIVLVN